MHPPIWVIKSNWMSERLDGRVVLITGGARRLGRLFALACARAAARDGALVCVAGSLYLVGEARRRLVGEEM